MRIDVFACVDRDDALVLAIAFDRGTAATAGAAAMREVYAGVHMDEETIAELEEGLAALAVVAVSVEGESTRAVAATIAALAGELPGGIDHWEAAVMAPLHQVPVSA